MPSWLGAKPANAPIKGPAQKAAKISAISIFGASSVLLNINTHKSKQASGTNERRKLSTIFQRLMARIG